MICYNTAAVINIDFLFVNTVGGTFNTVFYELPDFIVLNNGGIIANFRRHISSELIDDLITDRF